MKRIEGKKSRERLRIVENSWELARISELGTPKNTNKNGHFRSHEIEHPLTSLLSVTWRWCSISNRAEVAVGLVWLCIHFFIFFKGVVSIGS